MRGIMRGILIVAACLAIGGVAAAKEPTALQQAQAERRAEVQREMAERRAAVKERQAAWKASRKPGAKRGEEVQPQAPAFVDRRDPFDAQLAEQFRRQVTRRPPNARPPWADQPEFR